MLRLSNIKKIIITSVLSLFLINHSSAAQFTPPPIPIINTPAFKEYVKNRHTFPSPFGYEAFRDNKGNAISYLLSELNQTNPYIPVTLTCNTHDGCPQHIFVTNDQVVMNARESRYGLAFRVKDSKERPAAMIGFYFHNDPKFYKTPGIHIISNIKYGDPIVTILFSQRVLQQLSLRQGYIEVYSKDKRQSYRHPSRLFSPFSDGKESLSLGTTLYVMGLGQASGIEFTETVSQTTGETYTKQVQTGFSLNLNLQYEVMLGGGIFPVSESVRVGVNQTLSRLVGNELAINNQTTVTRSYTIKPGINDTYYWAIYQLGYSHRINAPLFESVLNQIQKIWDHRLTITIADNQMTQDNKPIGNILPPQASGIPNDITVGVAVPMNMNNNKQIYTQTMH